MSTSVVVIGGCALITAAIKAAGPVALGGRELPAWFTDIVTVLAPALLAALVATETLAEGQRLAVGAGHGGGGRGRAGGLAHGLDHRVRGGGGRHHRPAAPDRCVTRPASPGSASGAVGTAVLLGWRSARRAVAVRALSGAG